MRHSQVNIHAIEINTLINYTQRQQLMWKPIWENPQSHSSSSMINMLAPFVCPLNMHTPL